MIVLEGDDVENLGHRLIEPTMENVCNCGGAFSCDCQRVIPQTPAFLLTDEERADLRRIRRFLVKIDNDLDSEIDTLDRILDAPVQRCRSCRWWATVRKHEQCLHVIPDWFCADWEAKP